MTDISNETLAQWMAVLSALRPGLDGEGDIYEASIRPAIRAVADEMRLRLQRSVVLAPTIGTESTK